MDGNIDQTSQATVELLEARLRRLEHLLYGPRTEDLSIEQRSPPTVESLADLERRFASLVSSVRVYGELLKIYQAHPSLFQSPPADLPPTQLDPDALRAAVLSYASAFPATASALSAAVVDTPVPDTALSAQLVALVPRMEKAEAAQRDLERDIAGLRHRSEALVRQYYERQALGTADFVARVETRVERAEGRVRRLEKERRAADEI